MTLTEPQHQALLRLYGLHKMSSLAASYSADYLHATGNTMLALARAGLVVTQSSTDYGHNMYKITKAGLDYIDPPEGA